MTQARPREKLCWHTRSRQAPSPSFKKFRLSLGTTSQGDPSLSLSCQASTLLHCLTSEAPSCVRFCCGPSSPRIFPESVCMATKERHHYSGLACTELIGTALLLAVLLVISWHFIGVVATASLFSALELALSSSSSSSSCHQFDSQLTGLGPVNNV